jgi:short-subunit dehydrogenase
VLWLFLVNNLSVKSTYCSILHSGYRLEANDIRNMERAFLLTIAATLAYYSVRLARTDCDLSVAAASDAKINVAFKNKRVWITGGSSGIGKELALQLARIEGVKILISARSLGALEQVQGEIRKIGGHCEVLVVDLADVRSLDAKCETARGLLGGDVDIIVNNGGVSQRALGVECSLDVDLQLLNVDFVSATVITKNLARKWLEREDKTSPRGVINISSLAGKMGVPLRTYYCASKFALIGFMDSLRTEIAHEGNVTITNVCPGSVQTNVSKNALMGSGEKFDVTDPNIANGMAVERCVQLILRAHANKLPEVWFFGSRIEKLGVYIAQYAPTLMQMILKRQSVNVRQSYTNAVLASRKKQ